MGFDSPRLKQNIDLIDEIGKSDVENEVMAV